MAHLCSKSDFFKLEYQYLRSESLVLRARLVRILIGSVIGIPSFNVVIKDKDFLCLIVFFPLIIFTIILILVSESYALTRIGRYIKLNYEKGNNIFGWECWLSEKKDRLPNKLLNICFYLLFILYYVISCILSRSFMFSLKSTEGNLFESLILNYKEEIIYFYVVLGILIITLFIILYEKISTTKCECDCKECKKKIKEKNNI